MSGGMKGSSSGNIGARMQFIKFPNNKVWPVDEFSRVSCIVRADAAEAAVSQDDLNDAISEAVTGSSIGLTDISISARGGNFFEVHASVADMLPEDDDDLAGEGMAIITPEAPEFAQLIADQFGLIDFEAAHAVASLGTQYGDEGSLIIHGTDREIRFPAHPEECSYVRVLASGIEVAYWINDEWAEDPSVVMGALMGAASTKK